MIGPNNQSIKESVLSDLKVAAMESVGAFAGGYVAGLRGRTISAKMGPVISDLDKVGRLIRQTTKPFLKYSEGNSYIDKIAIYNNINTKPSTVSPVLDDSTLSRLIEMSGWTTNDFEQNIYNNNTNY